MPFNSQYIVNALVVVVAMAFHTSMGRSAGMSLLAFYLAVLRWKPIEWVIVVSTGAIFRNPLLNLINCVTALSPSSQAFLFLFVFKFFKVVVHTVSYIVYRPIRIPDTPTLTPRDCTVIVPTVGDLDDEFIECVRSILACNPAKVLVSTVGSEKLALATQVCSGIDSRKIQVIAVAQANKRAQIIAAANIVKTKITVLADDHVFWPTTFLQSALAPFEDSHVGLVGTVKRVRRQPQRLCFADFLNFVACIYLERHNFECTASHNIDSGVFVISGRTALLRTSIIQAIAFQEAFLNETWLWGMIGPMNVDDDNFICRWMVTFGYKIVFHNVPEALMETTLGTIGGWRKFRGQLERWARTTWRSNSTTLFADRTVWQSQPWCVYAVYFSAFVNFALFYDAALFFTLSTSSFHSPSAMLWLGGLLFMSKLTKPLPHFIRNPRDLIYVPFGIMFGYYHSLVKLYALLTCTNVAWGTRAGVDGLAVPPGDDADLLATPAQRVATVALPLRRSPRNMERALRA